MPFESLQNDGPALNLKTIVVPDIALRADSAKFDPRRDLRPEDWTLLEKAEKEHMDIAPIYAVHHAIDFTALGKPEYFTPAKIDTVQRDWKVLWNTLDRAGQRWESHFKIAASMKIMGLEPDVSDRANVFLLRIFDEYIENSNWEGVLDCIYWATILKYRLHVPQEISQEVERAFAAAAEGLEDRSRSHDAFLRMAVIMRMLGKPVSVDLKVWRRLQDSLRASLDAKEGESAIWLTAKMAILAADEFSVTPDGLRVILRRPATLQQHIGPMPEVVGFLSKI